MALFSRDSVWLLVSPVLRSEQSLRVLSHQTEIKMLLLIKTLIMTVATDSSRALFLSRPYSETLYLLMYFTNKGTMMEELFSPLHEETEVQRSGILSKASQLPRAGILPP